LLLLLLLVQGIIMLPSMLVAGLSHLQSRHMQVIIRLRGQLLLLLLLFCGSRNLPLLLLLLLYMVVVWGSPRGLRGL
jgi:hypothetical protein